MFLKDMKSRTAFNWVHVTRIHKAQLMKWKCMWTGKHRYSDVTSNSPSSEKSSPSYSYVLAGQEDSRTLKLENSMDEDFAEILHLRETDASEVPKYSTKASNMKQPTIHRPAERIMGSDTFSCDLNCDEDLLLEDGVNRDYCAPLGEEEGEASSETSEGRLRQIGEKTATAGWFVCEGEGLVLAHEDGFCSYHDVANMEVMSLVPSPTTLNFRLSRKICTLYLCLLMLFLYWCSLKHMGWLRLVVGSC